MTRERHKSERWTSESSFAGCNLFLCFHNKCFSNLRWLNHVIWSLENLPSVPCLRGCDLKVGLIRGQRPHWFQPVSGCIAGREFPRVPLRRKKKNWPKWQKNKWWRNTAKSLWSKHVSEPFLLLSQAWVRFEHPSVDINSSTQIERKCKVRKKQENKVQQQNNPKD